MNGNAKIGQPISCSHPGIRFGFEAQVGEKDENWTGIEDVAAMSMTPGVRRQMGLVTIGKRDDEDDSDSGTRGGRDNEYRTR